MKKQMLILLIVLNLMTWKSFCQNDTIIKLPINYARNIVKELIQFDVCKEQVTKQNELIALMESKQTEQNTIIESQRKLLIDKFRFSQNVGASYFVNTPFLFTNLNFGTSKTIFSLQMNILFNDKPHLTFNFTHKLWQSK
jgi:hypothetical protein